VRVLLRYFPAIRPENTASEHVCVSPLAYVRICTRDMAFAPATFASAEADAFHFKFFAAQ
jgi:hypothetical protein